MKVLKFINITVGLVLIVLLGVAGTYLRKLINLTPDRNTQGIMLVADADCDLNRQACIASLDNQSVELSVQQPVTYLTKFQIRARVVGFEKQRINKMIAAFAMPGMDMGINRFALQQTATDNAWQGMAILPVCATGRKDWRATVFIATDDSNYTAVYKLTVEN